MLAPMRGRYVMAMVVGILQFELLVRGSRSLKDKRRVVRSVKDRLHREHMVSVAEIGALDHHQLALLGLAVVSNSGVYANTMLDRIIAKLRRLRDAELGDVARETLPGAALDWTDGAEPLWTPEERRSADDGGKPQP